jgi:hypothetical protein
MPYRREPETFPGIGYYTPYVSASSSVSTLTMTDKEKEEARKREQGRGRFGFGRVLDEVRQCTSTFAMRPPTSRFDAPPRVRCMLEEDHYESHQGQTPQGDPVEWRSA